MSEGSGSGDAQEKVTLPVWPKHFPKGCPTSRSKAQRVSGLVYRFVEGKSDDWQSFVEREITTGCRAASLSCFISLEAAEHTKAVQGRWKNATIVCADLRPEHGLIEQTGAPGHHSLWLTRQALAMSAELFKALP